MTVFQAHKAISFTASGFSALDILTTLDTETTAPDPLVATAEEYKIEVSGIQLDFFSVSTAPFKYLANHLKLGPIEGSVASLQVESDTGGGLSPAYSITGISFQPFPFTQWVDLSNGDVESIIKMMFVGNDVITGSPFADYLLGFFGNDRITGGAGNDTMGGGANHDTFVFRHGFGHDVITDFQPTLLNKDVIEMHSLGIHSLAQVKAHSHVNAAGHLVIVVDPHDTITLNDVHSKAALVAADFHFMA